MDGEKVKAFMTLAGQGVPFASDKLSANERNLGAHLLLSEVLEYVIKGLGVTPVVNGVAITDPESVVYAVAPESSMNRTQMLDGLADVGYTMYWNALAFGLPLEEGFDLVCDNNLEKFIRLENWQRGQIVLERAEWSCGKDVIWPPEVTTVSVLQVGDSWFAVGKDARGKVRKPSTYRPVDLEKLANEG